MEPDVEDENYLFECFEEKPEIIVSKRTSKPPVAVPKKVKTNEPFQQEEAEIKTESEPEIEFEKLDTIQKPIDTKFLEEISYGKTIELECGLSCTHAVALSSSFEYKPLVNKNTVPAKTYPFVLDEFQKEAILCIDNDQSVLVSAHTSSGKTVVAEYAIAKSLRNHQRVIYTSPIKALSNQKYRELSEEFRDVGLQTGDVTLNPSASCVVMTTEILRSMLYRGSEIMREVAWVIFDEIHYMRDKERGVVWEETIIMLPDNVHYVFLSATIPNARQFSEWIAVTHMQPCHVVTTDFRPTPLQHYVYPSGGDGIFLVIDEHGDFKEQNFEKALSSLGGNSNENSSIGKRQNNKNASSNVLRVTKLIMERKYAPVIFFSFSKKECEYYALQISKLDFNSDREKKSVEEVFTNAIDCLSEDDKKLPQVESVLPLLKRGIGIHHSGLLPILKEVTEILFSEGLLKVLFSTETFAMGLNMPARTVVFTSCRKYDGIETRFIQSGEYIQMSGRAGRRGIDDRGICIIIIDDQITPDIAKSLVHGSSDPLNSAFRLTYNMILNLLRLEGVDPEYMMKKSFYQYQLSGKLPEIISKIKTLEVEYNSLTIENEQELDVYMKLKEQLDVTHKAMITYITEPKYILPFLQPGRLVRIKSEKYDFGWGCLINYQKKILNAKGSNPSKTVYIVEVLLYCSNKVVETTNGTLPQPCGIGENGEMRVVPTLINLISDISAIRFNLPLDIRPIDVRRSIYRSIVSMEKRFPDGLPLLDPIEDMGIQDKKFIKLIKRSTKLEERIFSNPLHQTITNEDDKLIPNSKNINENEHVQIYLKKSALRDKIKELRQELKSVKSIVQLNDLKARKRVLRRLGFIDASDIIDIKGRVACEISSGDELVLTEMLFNSVFNNMNSQQICAILSCFIYQEKSTEHESNLSEQLSKPLSLLQETVKRIAKISKDCKMVDFDSQTYASSFKTDLMDVCYNWANGASFITICKMTEVFEGNIIRCLRRLEELLKQLCLASKCIGSSDLEKKFSDCIVQIKRNIAFAASLYL